MNVRTFCTRLMKLPPRLELKWFVEIDGKRVTLTGPRLPDEIDEPLAKEQTINEVWIELERHSDEESIT